MSTSTTLPGTIPSQISKTSPFFHPGPVSTPNSLAIIHLKRDSQIPSLLDTHDPTNAGYSEGPVINTRFGSFPHSTLLNLPWGTQVRASRVDTGSRGRRPKINAKAPKRERDESEEGDGEDGEKDTEPREELKEAVVASSGFIHLLAPTPENWTSSLPHRTQVVYTPDYSYILHRIRARPGSILIEAGAGSGSFTHAAVRAVYSGYPQIRDPVNTDQEKQRQRKRDLGKVYSYEFHEQRYHKLQNEIQDHGLDGLVQITHRDVCKDGFLAENTETEKIKSPGADAIFLDLPAPWLALPHLSRRRGVISNPGVPKSKSQSASSQRTSSEAGEVKIEEEAAEPNEELFVSPLNPNKTTYICTFSPCIEQVQRTISSLRQLGWVSISMCEIAHRRLDIRRERIGIEKGQERGVQAVAGSVEEAVGRLEVLERRQMEFHRAQKPTNQPDDNEDRGGEVEERKEKKARKPEREKKPKQNPNSKESILKSLVEGKVYKEGRLVHRTEAEVKTHTSYLVFAVLPREWTEQQEEEARSRWRSSSDVGGMRMGEEKVSKRAAKKAARMTHVNKMRDHEHTEDVNTAAEEKKDKDADQDVDGDAMVVDGKS